MSMQRVLNCIKTDIKFQIKHGFYTVYVVLSIIYIVILSYIPLEAKKYVLPILIYSDPAGLGLFFIGGMVLLEKEQGVLALLYITPLKVYEYILSKVMTLGLISVLAAVAISLTSNDTSGNYFLLVSGTFLASVFYTLIGLIIASRAKTVNSYLVKMIPAILILVIPCLSLISNNTVASFINRLLLFVPSTAGMKLILGAFNNSSSLDILISLISLIAVNSLLINKVHSILTKKLILNE